ncbi:MAG: hypothetical protein F6J98_36860 [Moorea sp. SIO4G2]|nr:hypothetical protein [Moorena sp. SIO4G2]
MPHSPYLLHFPHYLLRSPYSLLPTPYSLKKKFSKIFKKCYNMVFFVIQ